MTSGYDKDNLCDRFMGALGDDRGLSDVGEMRTRSADRPEWAAGVRQGQWVEPNHAHTGSTTWEMKHVTDSTVLPGAQVTGGGAGDASRGADGGATPPAPDLEGADQAVIDLLGLIAYGELTAFERLATDARMAPTLTDKIALGAMAAAEFAHFEAISRALAGRGIDPEGAMAPFIGPLTAFHGLTAPADWLESLVKAYVGDSIAADFYRAIAHRLDDDARALVLDVLADTGHAAFVVDRVRAAIAANPVVAGRLALWARRLVGEALNQAKQVAVERDALTGLLVGVGDLEAIATIFDSIMKAHTDRMSALGLSA